MTVEDSESSDSDIDLDEVYPDPVIPAAHHGEVTPAGQSDLVTSGDNHQAWVNILQNAPRMGRIIRILGLNETNKVFWIFGDQKVIKNYLLISKK